MRMLYRGLLYAGNLFKGLLFGGPTGIPPPPTYALPTILSATGYSPGIKSATNATPALISAAGYKPGLMTGNPPPVVIKAPTALEI